MTDALSEFKELADRLLWRSMETSPKEQFIIVYCAEDNSRWWAKWQGGEWYGVDEYGLTRSGHSPGDAVTGWEVTAWMPIADPPPLDKEVEETLAENH